MRGLSDIFTTAGLVGDRNKDGVADCLSVSFYVQSGIVVEGLIDFCARLGLETSELDLPQIRMIETLADVRAGRDGEWLCTVCVNPSYEMDFAICQLDADRYRLEFCGGSEASLNRLLRWMAAHWPVGLVTEAEAQGIVKINCLTREIHLYHEADGQPVCEIAITSEREQLVEAKQSVDRPVPLDNLVDLWTTAGFYQAGRTDVTAQTDVFFTGMTTAEAVTAAARFAARIGLASTGIRFPLTGDTNRIAELTFSVKMEQTTPEEACVVEVSEDDRDATARVVHFTGGERAVIAALDYLGTATSYRFGGTFGAWEKSVSEDSQQQEFPVFLEKSWSDLGERMEMEQLFQKELETLAGQVASGKDVPSPLVIAAFLSEPEEIRRALEKSWCSIISNLLPDITCTIHIHSAFKPGLCWVKETILPQVIRSGKRVERVSISFQREAHEDGMELAHRWLQELYPVDQLLEKNLGISLSQISFQMEEELPTTYQVEIWGEAEKLLGKWQLDVPVAAVPYVDPLRKVYPTTSGLFITYGTTVDRYFIPTDRERFWHFYSQQFLPELTEALLQKQAVPYRGNIPLFHSIDVSVTMSEQEERLDIDEETISSLEALHEDIYFNTLDYYAHMGEKQTGVEWNSPGAIRPFIHVEPGVSPHATIRVKEYSEQQTVTMKTTHLFFDAHHADPVGASLVLSNGTTRSVKEWKRPPVETKQSPTLAAWSELASHPSVHIWEVEKSFEARPIYAVEVTAPRVSTYVATHKLSLHKATVLIEAGHHPNEVSSMPAIRELVEEIVTEKQEWLHRFNLVVIPFANPDGIALHQELVKDNPFWKHHAARYNAVGLEYTQHRFKPSIFGESRVVPQLFYRWLPDVIIDDHGIPSHEWTQPFAGYNSPPRFPVSYWIPISLFYGIGREMDRSEYPHHALALDTIQKATEDGMRQNPYLWNKNKRYVERYIRYGHNWDPTVFPLPDDDDLLFYRWPTKPDRSSTSLLSRFPEWVTLDLITEAADETVEGEALRDCIETHKVFNRAVLASVASCPQIVKRHSEQDSIRIKRMRPMQIGGFHHENDSSHRV
ncbi:M14 family metallopeptidase [Brevibacillus sp. NRS-1366]|uniref:M14 family metallopeptidase n=1 Tax=Brevibacillus sp. NRS-1366 TaxID=3233899 RepID=UPI003D1C6943